MQFSSEQLKAIRHGDGPALVIAGPGSGKTAVLTNRIKFLIEQRHIQPEQILVITFSKAAALEMESRFLDLCEDTYYQVNFGTFHSLFFRIIHNTYNYDTSNIATLKQKREYIRESLKRCHVGDIYENELLDSVLKNISFYKNTGEKEFPDTDDNITSEQYTCIYKEYCDIMTSLRKIDFDDMMLVVYRLFCESAASLNEYRERFKYILIDECQDINFIQLSIIKQLGGTAMNVFMVGDDDQSIYRFRGADYELMKRFLEEFPGTQCIYLTTNYRCSQEIIHDASIVIEENCSRFSKDIRGIGRCSGQVELISHIDRAAEEKWLLDCIKRENDLNETAILCRTNREASYYADVLRGAGIPCSMKEIPYNPYKSYIFRDMVHYLKLVEMDDRYDIGDFFAVMNKPVRYIGRSYISGKSVSFEELLIAYKSKPYMRKILLKFRTDILKMKSMDMYARINYVRKAIGYDEYVHTTIAVNKSTYDEYMETADMIQNLARRFANAAELERYAEEYEVALSDTDNAAIDREVQIMTYHASKGLEWNTVLLPHLNEGTVPNKKSTGVMAIEEERRMLYVAMTRAKNRLYLSYIGGTRSTPGIMSRFLYRLQKDKKQKNLRE